MILDLFFPGRFLSVTKIAAIVGSVLVALALAAPANAQSGCGTGADALANAYVRSNPMYAMYIGDLESYVAANRGHFTENGDAIRCARVMSPALLRGAIQSYDPGALRRQQELNTRLGSMGISPGPVQATPSMMFLAMGQQISWLAEVLPPAARGNYTPLQTPATEAQQMQAFAMQMLRSMLQDPIMRQTFAQMEPLVREGVQMEYQQLMAIAAGLPQ